MVEDLGKAVLQGYECSLVLSGLLGILSLDLMTLIDLSYDGSFPWIATSTCVHD